MKNKIVIIGLLITLMVLPLALSTEVIVIKRGRISQSEGKVYTLMTLSNPGSKQRNVRITMIMPELGLMKHSGRSDFSRTMTKYIELEGELEPGQHLVRIVISNDKFKRVKHRIIEIT